MGKLYDVIVKRFGCGITQEFSPKIFAITTTEQQILSENPDRLDFLLVNLGAQVCYVHFHPDVSASLGVYLDKNGGYWEVPFTIYGELVGYPWWCEGAGNTNLYVIAVKGVD